MCYNIIGKMQIHKIQRRTFLLGLLLLLGAGSLWAQSEARLNAEKEIKELRTGKLLVIIPSHLKTLNELHRLSQSEDLAPEQKAALQERYQSTIADRDTFHAELEAAFDTMYSFSDYAFIYDYQLRSKAPEQNFAEAPPIAVEDLSAFTHRLRVGKTRSAQQFGVQAIIITDEEGNDLSDPFPYYVKLNHKTWLNGLFAIFNPDGYRRRTGEELVERLNKHLEKFYSKVSVN